MDNHRVRRDIVKGKLTLLNEINDMSFDDRFNVLSDLLRCDIFIRYINDMKLKDLKFENSPYYKRYGDTPDILYHGKRLYQIIRDNYLTLYRFRPMFQFDEYIKSKDTILDKVRYNTSAKTPLSCLEIVLLFYFYKFCNEKLYMLSPIELKKPESQR